MSGELLTFAEAAQRLGVEVHGGRAYRRLMVACETPLEQLSHAGSEMTRAVRDAATVRSTVVPTTETSQGGRK